MVEIAGQLVTAVDIGLFAIFFIKLSAPFKVKLAEKKFEAFLFLKRCEREVNHATSASI